MGLRPRATDHTPRDWVLSSASLILTDGGLALSEPRAVSAQGSTKVLAASSLGGCLVFVSSAVVTVALAAIGRDMRLSPLDLQWVMNAELLPLAALTLVAGALGDRFGQKRIFLAGIALYGLGATAIGFAPSFAPLIVGRFLQGLGEALILPNGLSVLGQAFPADKKARAVGIWSAAAAVASGVAPAIAGAILDHGSWRTTFLMLLPVVAGALAVGTVWIPKDSPTSHARVDVGGAVFSTVGLGGLGAGLTSLTNGSGLNLWVLVTLIVGLGGLAGLIVTERRLGDNAMLPPSLFASRSVVGANLFTALLYGPFTVMLTLIPFVMIRGAHLPTLVAGLAFIPLQVLITVVSPLAGMLCRRFGRRLPLFAGGAVVALGCAMAVRIGPKRDLLGGHLPGHPVAGAGHEPDDRAVDDPRPHLCRVRSRRNRVWRQQRCLARRRALRYRLARRRPAAGRSSAVLGIPHGDGHRRCRLRLRHTGGVHHRARAPRRLHPAVTNSSGVCPSGARNSATLGPLINPLLRTGEIHLVPGCSRRLLMALSM
jgi:MFS family permease